MNISEYLRKKIKRSILSGDFQEKFITYELKTKLYDKKIMFYDEEKHESKTGLDYYLETSSKVFSIQAKKIKLDKALNQTKKNCHRKLLITSTKLRNREKNRVQSNLEEILNSGRFPNPRDFALMQFILWETPRLRQEHLMEVTRIIEEYVTGIKTYPLIFFYTTPSILKFDKNVSILFCDACDLIDFNTNNDITISLKSKKNGRVHELVWTGCHKNISNKIKIIETILIQNKNISISFGNRTLEDVLNDLKLSDLIKNQNGFVGPDDHKYKQYLNHHFEGFYKVNSPFKLNRFLLKEPTPFKEEILKELKAISNIFQINREKSYSSILKDLQKTDNHHPFIKELLNFEVSVIDRLETIKEEMSTRTFSQQLNSSDFPVLRAERRDRSQ